MVNQITPDIDGPPVDHEVMQEIQGLYGSLEADYRSNAPEGSVLAESEIQGGIFRVKQGSSLAKNAGKSLPSRTVVYDTRTGLESRVPTRSLYYQLGKRRNDGSRVYSLTRPEGIPERVPIEDTCRICLPKRNNVKRNFYSEQDLLDHYVNMHEREWNGMERTREIESRREDANRMERLIMGLTSALRPDITANLPEDVKEQIAELQEKAVVFKPSAKKVSE
jgi:hypothetical protein